MNAPLQLTMLMIQEPSRTGAARKSDPPTSKQAARAFNPKSIEMRILDTLKLHPLGLTIEELSLDLGSKEVSVSPRMTGLVERNLIREHGKRRNRSGHQAIVWVIA